MIQANIASRIEAAVAAVLPPSVQILCNTQDGHLVELELNGVRIQALWLNEGRLQQVREIINFPENWPDVAVAHHMSLDARKALSGVGIGWIDETGAAEIALESLIISKSGQPVETVQKSSRWAPSVLSTAEALLSGVKATVNAVQQATGLSIGSSTNALHTLGKLGLLHTSALRGRNSGRQIINPDELLAEYTAAAATLKPAATLAVGVTWQDPIVGLGKIGPLWGKKDIPWAATGTVAAAILAPYLTAVTTTVVYVGAKTISGLESVAARANLQPIEGGRLILHPFPTTATELLAATPGNLRLAPWSAAIREAIVSKEVVIPDSLRLAPWPRVYADLCASGVRGEEAAEHLKEKIYGQYT